MPDLLDQGGLHGLERDTVLQELPDRPEFVLHRRLADVRVAVVAVALDVPTVDGVQIQNPLASHHETNSDARRSYVFAVSPEVFDST